MLTLMPQLKAVSFVIVIDASNWTANSPDMVDNCDIRSTTVVAVPVL